MGRPEASTPQEFHRGAIRRVIGFCVSCLELTICESADWPRSQLKFESCVLPTPADRRRSLRGLLLHDRIPLYQNPIYPSTISAGTISAGIRRTGSGTGNWPPRSAGVDPTQVVLADISRPGQNGQILRFWFTSVSRLSFAFLGVHNRYGGARGGLLRLRGHL